MRQNEFSMIYAYLYNNQIRLEDTVKQLQSNVRFRKIDITDCVELLCAQSQLELFDNVVHDLCAILRIFENRRKNTDKE